MSRVVLLVGLLLSCSAIASGEEAKESRQSQGVLDLVPADGIAIGIRDVAELVKRGDRFLEKTEVKSTFRLSDGYQFVLSFLGIKKGVDPNGAAVLMMPWVEGDKDFDFNRLVLAVPVADFDAMTANFTIKREELVEGKVIKRPNPPGDSQTWYLGVRGKHLFIGPGEKHVAAAAKAKPLRETLSIEEAASFAQSDIFLYASVKHARGFWPEGMATSWEAMLPKLPADEAAALRQLIAASEDLDYLASGIRLEEGLGATVSLGFTGDKSREILTQLQGGGNGKTSLAGLPNKGLIAAHAAGGSGAKTSAVARGLLRYVLLGYQPDTEQFLSAGHQANVVDIFGEVWQQLTGSRSALLENENVKRDGQFSLVAILDTKDAKKFLADMQSLGRFISAAGFSLDDETGPIDSKSIAELVKQLGDEDYATRQTASTKLGLIGAAALGQLEEAERSTDLEVRARAQFLVQQIKTSLTGEKADLLKRDLLTRLRPQLVFFPKAERRGDRTIDIVQLRLQADEAGHAEQLRRLLGPEWNKLRLAVVGERVIVLLGSNTALLDQAIEEVSAGRGDALAEPFRSRLPPERTAEFHLSLTRTQQLLAASDDEAKDRPANPLTSFGVQILPQRVRLDLYAPYEEAATVIKTMGW